MNKVLLLDDRPERKKNHMSDQAIKKLSFCENQKYLSMDTVKTGINLNNVDKDTLFKYFEGYSLLAIHWSWLDHKKLVREVTEYAGENQKLLIFFSGGIGQTLLLDNYTFLSINSAEFYTDRLPDFIEKYITNEMEYPLLEFLYGESWRLPVYMQYRQILWKGISLLGEEYVKNNDGEYWDFEANYAQLIYDFEKPQIKDLLMVLNEAINKEILKVKTK